MSKSTGNVVDPVAVIDEWGVDAFRFYVLRELDIGPDGNWTDAGFQARYSAELANGLGNLVNRSLSMLKRYRNGVVPPASQELAKEAEEAIAHTRALLEQNRLQAALQSIWSLVTRANQYVDQTAPFRLAKDPAQAARLDNVLYSLAEVCRVLAVLLWPFLPGTASKIYLQLGLNGAPNEFSAARMGRTSSRPCNWNSGSSFSAKGRPGVIKCRGRRDRASSARDLSGLCFPRAGCRARRQFSERDFHDQV